MASTIFTWFDKPKFTPFSVFGTLCRLFFVVNKVDTIRMSEGLDEDATRQYVAELVTQQLSGDGFQLHPDQVL